MKKNERVVLEQAYMRVLTEEHEKYGKKYKGYVMYGDSVSLNKNEDGSYPDHHDPRVVELNNAIFKHAQESNKMHYGGTGEKPVQWYGPGSVKDLLQNNGFEGLNSFHDRQAPGFYNVYERRRTTGEDLSLYVNFDKKVFFII